MFNPKTFNLDRLKIICFNQINFWLGLGSVLSIILINLIKWPVSPLSLLGILLTGLMCWLEFNESKLTKSQLLLIVISVSILFGGVLFGPILNAKWGILDDHEIVAVLGTSHQLKLTEIPTKLATTEVGMPARFARFRPTYWVLRMAETSIWGDNPTLWYVVRFSLVLISMAVFWWLAGSRLGFGIGGGLLMYIWTFPFWTDVLGRLGPGETYCVAGLCLFGLGADQILRLNLAKITQGFWWVFWGIILAAGSKESFVVIILPLFGLGWWSLKHKLFTRLRTYLWWLSLGFILVIAALTSAGLIHRGIDIYAQSIAVPDRLAVLVRGLKTVTSLFLMIEAVFLGSIWKFNRNYRGLLGLSALGLVAVWLSYLFNWVFNNGYWPLANRYDYPFIFSDLAGWLIAIWCGYQILVLKKVSRNNLQLIRSASLGMILAMTLIRGYQPVVARINSNVTATNKFTSFINQTSALLISQPKRSLVIEVGRPLDMEPFWSYLKFLRFMKVTNPIFLKVNIKPSDIGKYDFNAANDAHLYELLKQWSEETYFEQTTPIKYFSNQGCWSLTIRGNSETNCEKLDVSGVPTEI